ncbi:MAG TPA: hypothetical protein VF532_19995 [Candidatus Angelobacter sp.]
MKRLLLPVLLVAGTLASAQQLPQPQAFRTAAELAGMPSLQLLGPLTEPSLTLERPKSLSLVANADMTAPAPVNPTFKPVIRPAKTPEVAFFNKKIFMAEVVAYTVPNILDGVTTVRAIRRGYTEGPLPWGSSQLIGERPGIARYTLVMGGMQAAVTFASYKLEHSRNRTLRLLGHSLMLKRSVDHTVGFVNNVRLGPNP